MADDQRTRLWVVSRHCLACNHCVEACRRRHGVARIRRVSHSLALSFPEVCQQCTFPLCEEHCTATGLHRDAETGLLTHRREHCVGCWSCLLACPYGAVQRDERDAPKSVRCDRCAGYRRPACVMGCPTGALRIGSDDQLAEALARPGGVLSSVVVALCFALMPLLGWMAGQAVPSTAPVLSHIIGMAAGGLMVLALLLPLLGRPLWSFVRRAVWTRFHMLLGGLSAGVAMAHAAGRFGGNVQTVGALSLVGLVLTGLAWRYGRPMVQMSLATFRRDAERHPIPAGQGEAEGAPAHPRVAAAEAARRGAASWATWLQRLDRLLAACHTLHIVWAILTVGLVLAHVIIMTYVGSTSP